MTIIALVKIHWNSVCLILTWHLYFLKSFVLHHKKPKEIVDPNIRTDFNKLAYLIKLDHGLGENFSVIKEIAEQGEIITDIVTHFLHWR